MKFTTSMRHAEYVLSDAPGLTVTDLWPSTDMDELLNDKIGIEPPNEEEA